MRIILFALFFYVLPKIHAQTLGVSVMAEHSPMDISGFNEVIFSQLNEPVIANASAFLKFGAGFDFTYERFTTFFGINSFASSHLLIADTTYDFGNFKFEWNFGYRWISNRIFGLESYVGWVLNNTSYSKSFNQEYSTLNQYWSSPYRFKGIVYNLHYLQLGLRIHSKKISINRNSELGFSLRGGVLFPLGTGKIASDSGGGQKFKSEELLIKQPFYVGLLITLSNKDW